MFKNVTNILKSGWLTHGKYTSLFEEEFKKFTKSKYAITYLVALQDFIYLV